MSKSQKREAPDPVTPVVVGSVRYEAPHFAGEVGGTQNGGYVTANDLATGERLWTLRVYEIAYDPQRERDVQDLFITELTDLGGGQLRVHDEDGRRFVVDVAKRSVRAE